MKKYLNYKILLAILVVTVLVSSCRTHRDCRGRKQHAPTQMGGWL